MDRHKVPGAPSIHELRVRIASLSNAAMFADALASELRGHSCDAAISVAGFDSAMAELLSSPVQTADAMMILLDEAGLPRRDWRLSAEEARSPYAAWVDMLIAAMDCYAEQQGARLFVNTVPLPVLPSVGLLDGIHADGQSFRISDLNGRLRQLSGIHGNLCVIESDVALDGLAPAKRTDPKLWFYGRIPYSSAADYALAAAFASAISEIGRQRPKVLALDLDDTLWRGLYGECGALGVECGDDFPGNAFRALQEECLRLKSQGMLLAILSKNDPDALEVFDKHPGMLLRRSDFVATRVNWAPKADNIRGLATELGVGLDSFLFIDDSPHEREAMRRLAEPVRVFDLPDDPALRPAAIRAYWPLWPVRLTKEDSGRTEMYAARLAAKAAQSKTANLHEYLRSLQQKLVVESVSDRSLARIAQMHERTNQFNLTTKRLSQSDLSAMIAQPDRHLLLQGHVCDRFGDHGVVICATAGISGAHARIISFLMSCRVIGREVEAAFLGEVIEALAARGIDRVEAEFIPTERNGPAAGFLQRSGLVRDGEAEGKGELWIWKAGEIPVPRSHVVDVVMSDDGSVTCRAG